MTDQSAPLLLHANAVDVDGRGLLIVGASGRGKSSLTLELMALGATLVSDDRTEIHASPAGLVARAPSQLVNLIEARGVGVLKAAAKTETRLQCVVDLDRAEQDRLPRLHTYQIGNDELPCLRHVDAPYFAPAVLQMLRAGRSVPS